MLLILFAVLLQDNRDLYEGRLSLGGAGKHLREDLLVLRHALPELEDLLGHSLEARLDGVALGGFDLVQVVHVEVVSRDHLVNAVDALLELLLGQVFFDSLEFLDGEGAFFVCFFVNASFELHQTHCVV